MKCLLLQALFAIAFLCSCQPDRKTAKICPEEGDLIFQDLDCGDLCDAIEMVTHGRNNLRFSHIGLVLKQWDTFYVVEAIGQAVQLTPLEKFTSRTSDPMYIGRLKPGYKHLVKPAMDFAIKQVGIPYDDLFIYNNGKYYCSELVYDAFKQANHDSAFFTLEPMTYKKPGSTSFFPAWVEYYKTLHAEIPEGMPGINPAGISRSERLQFFKWLNL